MKKMRKGLWALCLALVLMLSGAVVAFASTVSENDFVLTVKTDKDVYSSGESINLSIYLESNAAEDVTINGTKLFYEIPEAIQEYIVNYDNLPETIDLTSGENVVFLSVTTTVPDTGDTNSPMLYIGILMIGVGFILLTRTRYFKNFTALFMVAIMIVGLGPVSATTVKAEIDYLSVEGSKTITYAGDEQTIAVVAVICVGEYGEGDEEDNDTVATELSGTELAKLLLANARLDADALSASADDMLATNAASMYSASRNLRNLSSVITKEQYMDCARYVEYFDSYVENVNTSIESAAEQITYIKENVANTDVWLVIDANNRIRLDVTANEDILYIEDEYGTYVCRRYTDADGDDVYEIYQESTDGAYNYMLCVPGEWYEYSNDDDINVIVENTRGYWNMCTVYDMSDYQDVCNDEGEVIDTTYVKRMNMQNLVVTDNYTYVYEGEIYDSGYVSLDAIGYVDSTLSCDLMKYEQGALTINLVGFDGVSSITIDEDKFITSLKTTSGKELIPSSEKPIDAGIYFSNGVVEDFGDIPYPVLAFEVKTTDDDENTTNVNIDSTTAGSIITLLAEYGITCKAAYADSLNEIIKNISSGTVLAANFVEYYSWNDYHLSNYAEVQKALAVTKEKQDALMAKYNDIADEEGIEYTYAEVDYDDYSFANATMVTSSATVEGRTLTVEEVELTVSEEEAVLEEGTSYGVYLAICSADEKGIICLTKTSPETVEFDGSSALTVSVSGEYEIPSAATAGNYIVCAYVATEEGIRISEYVAVTTTHDVNVSGAEGNGYSYVIQTNDNDEISVSYISTGEYEVTVDKADVVYSYEWIYNFLSDEVLKYGYPIADATLYAYGANEYVTVDENDTISSGTIYMLEFENGSVFVKLP